MRFIIQFSSAHDITISQGEEISGLPPPPLKYPQTPLKENYISTSLSHTPFRLQPLFEPYLATQLEHTEIVPDSHSPVPLCRPREGLSLLSSFSSLSSQLPPSRDREEGKVRRQLHLLWGLGVALWGKLSGEEDGECASKGGEG